MSIEQVGAIVLARMDSSRLPGKGLTTVAGKPVLSYVLERAAAVPGINRVILATSERSLDDPLENFARQQNVDVFRGSLDDVAGRVLGAAHAFGLNTFARVNGDSPLLDFDLLGCAVALLREGNFDIVTNVLKRTFPSGMSVEVLTTEAFARGYKRMSKSDHFEHVTSYFYEHAEHFKIHNIESGHPDLARLHAAVDTPEDLAFFSRILRNMERSHLDYTGEQLLNLIEEQAVSEKKSDCKGREPLVTVYITNYNYGKYVKQAIESVLGQTMPDFELIIIDDGSMDDSREIIAQYAGKPNVRIIFQQNKGLNRTSNIALNASRGTYIMRLDADDFLDPQALLVMTDVLERDPELGLVFPDYYYVDSEGNITGQERRHDFKDEVSLLDQPAHGACTLIRKRCLQGIGGYCEDYRCQDGYDLWLRFIEKWGVKNVHLPLFYYRRHGENLTGNSELIIRTRAEIKKAHIRRTGKPPCDTLAIIPVRGQAVDPGCLSLEDLKGKALLDWTVEAALEATQVKGVVVTSPDPDVLAHVCRQYGSAIISLNRPLELARESVRLTATIDYVLESLKGELKITPNALIILSHETPFREAMYLEKAIHTMRIFDLDSVIAIKPENDLFFRHDGSGLKLVGNAGGESRIRFEREYLYRKLPGLNLVSMDFYRRWKSEMGGRIGHVVYAPRAVFTVRSGVDLAMARALLAYEENTI